MMGFSEFKFTAASNEDFSRYYPEGTNISLDISIENFDLDLEYEVVDYRDLIKKPAVICSRELYTKSVIFSECAKNMFNPYDVNRGINVYQDLSKMDPLN